MEIKKLNGDKNLVTSFQLDSNEFSSLRKHPNSI